MCRFFAFILIIPLLIQISCGDSGRESSGDPSFLEVFDAPAKIEDDRSSLSAPIPKASSGEIFKESADQKKPDNTDRDNDDFKLHKKEVLLAEDNYHSFKIYLKSKTPLVSLSEDVNTKTIFIAEKYKIISFQKPEIDSETRNSSSRASAETILDSEIFKKQLGEEMPAISTIAHLGSLGLWAGFENGKVLYQKNNQWILTSGGPQFTNQRINLISSLQNIPFVAGSGLFQWDEKNGRYLVVTNTKGHSVRALKPLFNGNISLKRESNASGNSLIYISDESLFRLTFPNREIEKLFSVFRDDMPLSTVHEFESGITVGSKNGLLILPIKSGTIKRMGGHIPVNEIVPLNRNDSLIISKNGNLHYKSHDQISKPLAGLKGSVRQAFLDSENNLWFGLEQESGSLLLSISVEELSKLFKNQIQSDSDKENPFNEIFNNSCEAFVSLFGKISYSGQLSRKTLNREPFVFLKGKQICPSGTGRISPDGTTALAKNNSITIIRSSQVDTLKMPERIDDTDISALYYHHPNDSIFLGTKNNGLFIGTPKGSWEKVKSSNELVNDHITDIESDDRGNIWVASRYQGESSHQNRRTKNEDSISINYRPLHVLTEHGWAHLGEGEGIYATGISEIYNNKNQIQFSIANGIGEVKNPKSILKYSNWELKGRQIIESFTWDPEGRIYLTHGFFLSGVTWIENEKLHYATKESGLFSDRIAKSGIDSENRIWLIDTAGRTGVYSLKSLKEIELKKAKKLRPPIDKEKLN
ncbi:MAG TPA: hypothetical protein PKA63_08025 [Oligoflexia bacterium]|nr:hypothetical protein [Oligoflexia bacterium]HMP48597.1 hypothetical protein [Oligoflexia bacterium]